MFEVELVKLFKVIIFLFFFYPTMWLKGSEFEDSEIALHHFMQGEFLMNQGNYSLAILEFQDAIDLDFSNLFIKRMEVNNAGNDCLDISAGIYKIDKINSSKCIDKGISVGEGSDIKIENLEIDGSEIGIVIKDSSYSNIKKGKVINSKMCLAMYRKKQEFSGSYLEIPKQTCDKNKIYIQKNSLLRFL